MRPRPAPPPPQRRLAWLCCLGLLLALAQSVAAWHGLSHAASRAVAASASPGGAVREAGDESEQTAPHAALCQLCLAGAVVGAAGASPGTGLLLSLPAWRHPAPESAYTGVWQTGSASAYASRGPPVAPG